MASHHTSSRIQSPSLAARHCMVSTLPTYSLSSLNTLTVTHSVPSTLLLEYTLLFPPVESFVDALRKDSHHSDPLPHSFSLDWLLSVLQISVNLCVLLRVIQSNLSKWLAQSRWPKKVKEGKKGKREGSNNCLLHCFLHTVWSYKYINTDNSIWKLIHYEYYYDKLYIAFVWYAPTS